MVITLGATMNPLKALEAGARATWFPAKISPQAARKRWIGAMKPKGSVQLDAGAVTALREGKSLLPAGIIATSGTYDRGDPVSFTGSEGRVLGLGLSRYTSAEAGLIKGRRSGDIAQILGYEGRAAFIHRDDLVLQDRTST